MAEKTFATMHQTLRDLQSATEGMSGYSPKQTGIAKDGLSAKVTTLGQLDGEITDKQTSLKQKQDRRVIVVNGKLETNSEDGLVRLSRQVATYVDGLGDEYESQLTVLRRLINRMAPSTTRRKPKDEKDKTRSTSEQSYASIAKCGEEFYSVIEDIADYSPADPKITLAGYLACVTELKTLNADIADLNNKQLKPLIKKRQTEYHSKTNGVARILSETKKYVSGNYGKNSDEYNKIKHLKV
ncbi:MAG: hypothetical protein HYZ34_02280 [Ignavibacteriae bacterium]|nr:hypothetical protein [Ignavibacteriota bacterium]